MNKIQGANSPLSKMIALAILLTACGMNVHGWSISGTVKSSSGIALSGVAVTVQDSSKYSTTTDTSGAFKLESPTAILDVQHTSQTGAYSVQVAGNKISINCPQNDKQTLSLVNSLGRTVWTSNVIPVNGIAQVNIPARFRHEAVFLQIRHASGVEYRSVGWGDDGSLHVKNSVPQISAATVAANPILIFKKTDYNDTSYSMTSQTMTNVAVTMQLSSTQTCALPTTTLKWQSSGILVNIMPDTKHPIVSVKDPTIQKYNGKYLIYCTVYNPTSVSGSTKGWSMQFIQFTDFSQANAATPTFMDQISGFSGYKCAPELFYFEPKKLWYLIWQQQDPAYSTTTTPDNPSSWSAPTPFFSSGMPKPDNWGTKSWLPIDYFPIADENNFYIFFTGDDGNVFRIKTTLANFPSGFSTPVVVKTLGTDVIFEGSSHYKVKGTTNTYLHLVEGMGSTGRYYSAWISTGIEGAWQDYKAGQSNPFARSNYVTFASGVTDWSNDVSHGELLRDNPNQTQEVDPCNLQLLYQGMDPTKSGVEYGLLPYKIGLLTLQ